VWGLDFNLDHQDHTGFRRHFGPFIQPMADNPAYLFRVAHNDDFLPHAPGNFRVHKEVLQFLGSPQSQRLKTISRLPMAKMDGPGDFRRIQAGAQGGPGAIRGFMEGCPVRQGETQHPVSETVDPRLGNEDLGSVGSSPGAHVPGHNEKAPFFRHPDAFRELDAFARRALKCQPESRIDVTGFDPLEVSLEERDGVTQDPALEGGVQVAQWRKFQMDP
jgi:hypothetical protein